MCWHLHDLFLLLELNHQKVEELLADQSVYISVLLFYQQYSNKRRDMVRGRSAICGLFRSPPAGGHYTRRRAHSIEQGRHIM
jgi:hypothetical protein